jgi:hypothetical protein
MSKNDAPAAEARSVLAAVAVAVPCLSDKLKHFNKQCRFRKQKTVSLLRLVRMSLSKKQSERYAFSVSFIAAL